MALNVIKHTRVRPVTNSSPDSVNSLVLPLTFFDLRWIRSHPTEQVIFYSLPVSESSREHFHTVILPKLDLSLSLVLSHYLPLAGQLTWLAPQDPKPSIIVSGDSTVSLTVAESESDFSRVSGKGSRLQSELRVLVPELTIASDSASLLSLQITLFPDQGGFSIGITEHHVVKDAIGSALFIKSWAHICKSGTGTLPEELTPVIDRTVIINNDLHADLESKMLETNGPRTLDLPPVAKTGSGFVRFTLELTRGDIDKLKERAASESTRRDLHLSTFVVVSACLWSCMVKARGGDADRPVAFMYAADFRNRLNRPVPENYFGNCVSLVVCFGHEAKTLTGKDGFVNAVEILTDSVKDLGSRGAEAVCEMYVDGMKKLKPGTQVDSVSGSNRIGIYGADFGWGRPVNSEIVSIDRYPAFTMSNTRDEIGGVEIGLCLTKSEMDNFISVFTNELLNIVK